MATQSFVDSVVKEIIQPGVDELVELPYFTELRAGKLSKKRLQGWALQRYMHNHALLKGFALCMVKIGVMEYWSDGVLLSEAHHFNAPSLQRILQRS